MQDANLRPDVVRPNAQLPGCWAGRATKVETVALSLSAIVALAWIERCIQPQTAVLFDVFVAALSGLLAYMSTFLLWALLKSRGWVASRSVGFAIAIASGLIAGDIALVLDTANPAKSCVAVERLHSAPVQPLPTERGGTVTFAPTFIDQSTIIEVGPAMSTSSSEPKR